MRGDGFENLALILICKCDKLKQSRPKLLPSWDPPGPFPLDPTPLGGLSGALFKRALLNRH